MVGMPLLWADEERAELRPVSRVHDTSLTRAPDTAHAGAGAAAVGEPPGGVRRAGAEAALLEQWAVAREWPIPPARTRRGSNSSSSGLRSRPCCPRTPRRPSASITLPTITLQRCPSITLHRCRAVTRECPRVGLPSLRLQRCRLLVGACGRAVARASVWGGALLYLGCTSAAPRPHLGFTSALGAAPHPPPRPRQPRRGLSSPRAARDLLHTHLGQISADSRLQAPPTRARSA